MLVLARKLGERLVIRCGGEIILIHALEVSKAGMSVGFTAEAAVEIFREEVARRKGLGYEIDQALADEEGTALEIEGRRVDTRLSSYYADDQLDG